MELSRLIWSYPENSNGPRTVSGNLFWSGGLKQALPETVLGPFQAAYFGPTLLILVLHLYIQVNKNILSEKVGGIQVLQANSILV